MMNNTNNTHPPPLVPFGAVEFGAVDAKTLGVMQNCMNPKVSDKYGTQNKKFLLWLFEKHKHYGALMKLAFLEELTIPLEEDRA